MGLGQSGLRLLASCRTTFGCCLLPCVLGSPLPSWVERAIYLTCVRLYLALADQLSWPGLDPRLGPRVSAAGGYGDLLSPALPADAFGLSGSVPVPAFYINPISVQLHRLFKVSLVRAD